MSLKLRFEKFLFDQDGATAVEYAVMLALILVVVIVGITSVGGGANGWWNRTNNEFSTHGF